MSLINEYRQTENAIKELQDRLAKLQGDTALQTEIEFEGKLRNLLGEYSKSLRDVVAIMDPESMANVGRAAKGTTSKVRRQRKIKSYKNPHNGEVIETKGGNHKGLKEWKAKWGSDEVESWASIAA